MERRAAPGNGQSMQPMATTIERVDAPRAECRDRALAELSRHPFRPAWWLPSPHLQTLWGTLFRRAPHVAFDVETLDTPDGDFLHLHRCRSAADALQTPTVLIIPGLESSIRSSYLRATAHAFHTLGWNTVIMEHRGCSREMNRARRLYHSGATDDFDRVARRLAAQIAPQPLYLVGFSLGGNVAAKWLGECGADAPVRAAALVALPFDLATSADALDRSLCGIYARHFTRTLIAKAVAKERQFPGCIDIARVRRTRTIVAFDDAATAPLHGFRDAQDYYARCSCGPFLERICVPTLLIASADDPYNPASTLPREAVGRSPWLIPLFTTRGGHQGFVSGPWPWRATYWAEEQVVGFLRYCNSASEAEQPSMPPARM
jgi:predicted alpha/beta-fold hydrolase